MLDSVRNAAMSFGLRRGHLYLYIVTTALIDSCSENLNTGEFLPTLAPSAVPLVNVPDPPTPMDTPTERPTLPPTSTQRVITETPTEQATDIRERIPEVPVTGTPSPTIGPPSVDPTLPPSTPTPTEMPPSPTQTATTRLIPLPPDEPWPDPTQYPHPVSNSRRHGVAAAIGVGDGSGVRVEEYARTYSWAPVVPAGTNRIQHIPMLTGGPSNGLQAIETIVDMDGRADHDYWLVFDECEQHWQCDASPQEASIFYHDEVVTTMYGQEADPDAKLTVGGVNVHACGI